MMKARHYLYALPLIGFLCLSFTPMTPYSFSNDNSRFELSPDTVYLRLETRIKSGENDVEENGLNGNIYTNSSDLELCYDRNITSNQVIGLRFTGIWLPPGATITKAYIQFTADESQNSSGSMIISGEDAIDSAPFETTPYNVSTRARTAASASWMPENWVAGESGIVQRTTDISEIVEEIVSKPDWTGYGLPMTFIIEGEGQRIAKSYELNPNAAPMLYVEYDF